MGEGVEWEVEIEPTQKKIPSRSQALLGLKALNINVNIKYDLYGTRIKLSKFVKTLLNVTLR